MKLARSIRILASSLVLAVPFASTAQDAAPATSYVGAGLRSRPAYDGSNSQRAQAIPELRYYGTTWFARTTQGMLEGGARVDLAPGLAFGGQLAYESGRSASESAFLRDHNVADVDTGASLGVHLEWDHKIGPMPINLLGRLRQRTDSDLGAQADLRFTAGIYGEGRVQLGAFAQATWANAKSARAYYGITPAQAAATGLPAFDPGSGLLYTSLGLLGSVDIDRKWVAIGSLESRHLRGDAASSPLAERKTNYYASAGVAYRF